MTVKVDKRVVKKIRKFAKSEQPKVKAKIYGLREFDRINKIPHNGKLKGTKDRYKIRVGDYRIIYKVESQTSILITSIADRKEVYNELFSIVFSL